MNPHITDRYWMNIAKQVAEASTCRVKVGCIILWKNTIVGMGYNGSIHGDEHCEDVGCLFVDNPTHGKSCIRTIHAEMNAILKCEQRGDAKNPLSVYSTHQPCLICFKMLRQIGVYKICYENPYIDGWRDKLHERLISQVKAPYMYRIPT